MLFCTVVQLIELFPLPDDGIQLFLPLLILLLSFFEFVVEINVLALQLAVHIEMLSFRGRVVLEAHGFHVIQLLLELNQGQAAEDVVELVVKLLHCQSQRDHLLMRLLLLYFVSQFLLLELELFDQMLDMQFFFQQDGIEPAILILDMGKLQYFSIHHFLDLFLKVCGVKFLQFHVRSLVDLFLVGDEPRERLFLELDDFFLAAQGQCYMDFLMRSCLGCSWRVECRGAVFLLAQSWRVGLRVQLRLFLSKTLLCLEVEDLLHRQLLLFFDQRADRFPFSSDWQLCSNLFISVSNITTFFNNLLLLCACASLLQTPPPPFCVARRVLSRSQQLSSVGLRGVNSEGSICSLMSSRRGFSWRWLSHRLALFSSDLSQNLAIFKFSLLSSRSPISRYSPISPLARRNSEGLNVFRMMFDIETNLYKPASIAQIKLSLPLLLQDCSPHPNKVTSSLPSSSVQYKRKTGHYIYILLVMGKFTKDKRVTKNNQYSNHDIYYRKAKEECYRARSAYKLLQIDDIYHIFAGVERVVDLCGAPGSWSQVCRKKLGEKGLFEKEGDGKGGEGKEGERIVSVDLQETAPIDNVHHIVGDITKGQTLAKILEAFQGQLCELVICDGAPDITGFHDMDQYIQSQLLVAALNITVRVLKRGGNFVAKVFKGSEISFLYSQFKLYFREIHIIKPNSSRESSAEHFLVGLNFHKDQEVDQVELSTFFREVKSSPMEPQSERIFKFVTCGDLSGFDPIGELPEEQQ